MGRGRGKGKKLTAPASNENPPSGMEEPIPCYDGTGMPHLKDEIDAESVLKMEANGESGGDSFITPKETIECLTGQENGKKRRRHCQVKDSNSPEENIAVGDRVGNGNFAKPIGFRPNGSRRKSKPRRAAEVGVECKLEKCSCTVFHYKYGAARTAGSVNTVSVEEWSVFEVHRIGHFLNFKLYHDSSNPFHNDSDKITSLHRLLQHKILI